MEHPHLGLSAIHLPVPVLGHPAAAVTFGCITAKHPISLKNWADLAEAIKGEGVLPNVEKQMVGVSAVAAG